MIQNKSKICVLLLWSINKDSRAQRTIREMSNYSLVDVYTVIDKDEVIDQSLYNNNVHFHIITDPKDYSITNKFIKKIIKHTFFYLNHKTIVKYVLSKKEKYSIIYAHDLPSAYPALKIAEKLNSKIIYDVHDLYIETINQQFPINSTGIKKYLYKLTIKTMRSLGQSFEKKFIKKTSILFTTTHSYLNYLKETYSVPKGVVFGNFPEYREIKKTQKIRETLKISENDNIVLYHGNLGRGRSLEFIVESAQYLTPNNKLVIIGDGLLKSSLKTISEKQNTTDRVFFLKSIKYQELFDFISSATLGLMLLDPINKSKEFALANKISEYMACGVVPLVSDHVENRRLVEDTNCGFVYRGNKDPKEFGTFINECLSSQEEIEQKIQVAKQCYTNIFNWEKEKIKFIEPFEVLLNSINKDSTANNI